ncbi:MAG: hypothetical protein ISS58_07470 [Dehalococcoidales bacterium]|nr:hypothetical protein [Dehalococcoidales bacterium]
MEVWQQILIYAVIGFGGVVLGAWLQRRAMREERAAREETELTSSMRNLLSEIESNLGLIEQPLTGWSLAPFETDIWDAHKGKILYLSSELQKSLREAYLWIHKANAVVETHLAHDSRGGGHFDNLYRQMIEKVKAPAQKARDELKDWLNSREA